MTAAFESMPTIPAMIGKRRVGGHIFTLNTSLRRKSAWNLQWGKLILKDQVFFPFFVSETYETLQNH